MAAILPKAKTQFFDSNGDPLSSGTVEFYVPGTLTPKDTWQDLDATILNTNPVDLDAAGRAIIVGVGRYRQIVKDSLGNQIWDQITAGDLTGVGVDTISALRALPGTAYADGQLAEVLGYYVAGDGGGGPFYWDASSTAADDGATVIKPTAVSGAGRWIALGDMSDVRRWGCKLDGSNDAVAFQNALNYASDNGVTLILPGVVSVGVGGWAGLSLTSKNDWGISAEPGAGIKVLAAPSQTIPTGGATALLLTTCERVSIKGLDLDGNSVAANQIGLYQCVDSEVRGCRADRKSVV